MEAHIDIEDDQRGAIVPVLVPDSPSKRPKTTSFASSLTSPPLDPNQLLSLIQSTIQDSVASSLSSVQSSLQGLVGRVTVQKNVSHGSSMLSAI